jgi:uncharacterized protein (TIGR02996 family)
MQDEAILHEAIRRDPGDKLAWLALADWLEENGQPDRAELLRLWRKTRTLPWDAATRRKPEREIARLLRAGVRPAVPQVVNSIGMKFALVPPGTFELGSDSSDQGDEKPQIEVEMPTPYYLGVYPVTQQQYRKVTRSSPSHYRPGGPRQQSVLDLTTDDFPADSVSWTRAAAFCARLSGRPDEKAAGRVYRLPTESEWAYAARAAGACSTAFLFGNSLASDVANFIGESPFPADLDRKGPSLGRPCPVGRYPPNALGLYDVLGNVWEWVDDWHTSGYSGRPRVGGTGPDVGSSRVLRGGSWSSHGWGCRLEYRNCIGPDAGNENFGFRVLLEHRP